jgi:hypothetical protein
MPAFAKTAVAVAFVLSLAAPVHAQPAARPDPITVGGPHDFDFEFGDWKCHLKRLLHPLTGSTQWVEYDGSSDVRQVWNGRANLSELELNGPAGHLEGLSLRVYSPQTRQWTLTYANSAFGMGGPPLVGAFQNGRGEFYASDTLNGRAILVRFIFSDLSKSSFRLEQAYSDDGGKTWEANWIATFTQ